MAGLAGPITGDGTRHLGHALESLVATSPGAGGVRQTGVLTPVSAVPP
jgi:hypothetical protein